MGKEYAPRMFLRDVPNELLKEYFTKRGELAGINWDDLEETAMEPVYNAWQALPEQAQEEIERDFREIYDLASPEGTRAIVEEGRFHGTDLIDDIELHEGFLNKAFWVFLNHRRIFAVAYLLDRADRLNRRYWRKRKDIPRKEPDVSEQARQELGKVISAYYRENQGRGRHCHVDAYLRNGRYHYFFAYPQDYTDTFVGYTEAGEFDRRPQSPAFEVIFVYDPTDGALDLFAQGGKEIVRDLQQLFGRTILHEELGEEDTHTTPYELNGLKNADVAFPTDPTDRITEVRVRGIRFSVVGSPRRRITFEVDPKGSKDELYQLIDKALHKRELPLAMVNVSSATIQVRFDNTSGRGRSTKTVSFTISYPNSCSLRDKPEHMTIKAYLKRWKIERD